MIQLIALFAVSIAICFIVAKRRKANVGMWVAAAAVVGPLAVPFVFFSKPE